MKVNKIFVMMSLLSLVMACQNNINEFDIFCVNGIYQYDNIILDGSYKIHVVNKAALSIDHYLIMNFENGIPKGKYEEWYEGELFDFGKNIPLNDVCVGVDYCVLGDYYQEGEHAHSLMIHSENPIENDSLKYRQCYERIIGKFPLLKDSLNSVFVCNNMFHESKLRIQIK